MSLFRRPPFYCYCYFVIDLEETVWPAFRNICNVLLFSVEIICAI